MAIPVWAQEYDRDESGGASSRSERSSSRSNRDSDDDSYSQLRSQSSDNYEAAGNQRYNDRSRQDRSDSRQDRYRDEDRSSSRDRYSDQERYSDRDRERSTRDSQSRRSSDDQWSNWDSEKDTRKANVWRASNLIGKSVMNGQGEELGTIEDIVLDVQQKQIRYAAIAYGGVLGMGEKLFAVPLDALKLQRDTDGETVFILNVDQATLDNAQGFEERDRWPAQADNSWSRRRASASSTASSSGQQKSFEAKFEEYDDDGEQLVVQTSDERRRVYNVAPDVRVTQNGQRAFFDDLDEGAELRISYTRQGDKTLITAVEDRSQQQQASRSRDDSNRIARRFSYNPDERTRSERNDRSRRQDEADWDMDGTPDRDEDSMFDWDSTPESQETGNEQGFFGGWDDDSDRRDSSDRARSSRTRSNTTDRSSTMNRDPSGSATQSQTIRGELTSVESDSFSIRTDEGQSRTFNTGTNTSVRLDGESSELRDLEEGQQVTVRTSSRSGQQSVISIQAESQDE